MADNRWYTVELRYDLDHYFWGQLDRILEKATTWCSQSGTEGNERYLHWASYSKEERDTIAKKLKALKYKHVEIVLSEETD